MDTYDSYKSNLPARFTQSEPPAMLPERGGANETSRPVNARVILRGLARYWWQMLVVWFVITVGLETAIYLKIQPTYEAISLLQAEPAAGNLFTVATAADNEAFLETQVNLIKSTAVLSAATLDEKAAKLPRIQMSEDPTVELRNSLDVMTRQNTFLIQVGMRSTSATEAATLVNAVVNAYVKANAKLTEGASIKQEKSLEDAKQKLERTEKDLVATWRQLANKTADAQIPVLRGPGDKNKGEVAEGKGTHSVTLQEYEKLKSRETKIKEDLLDAEILLKYLESQPRTFGSSESKASKEQRVTQALRDDPELSKIEESLAKIDGQLEKLRSTAVRGEYDAAGRKLTQQRAQLVQQLQEERGFKEVRIRSSLESGRAGAGRDPLFDARGKVSMLRESLRRVSDELAQIQNLSRQEAGDAVDIYVAQEELRSTRDMKMSVVKKLEDLKFAAKGGAKISVADEAVPPNKPSSNSRPKLLLATPAVVLVALMALCILMEIRSGRVGHPDELTPRMRAEVFAVPPLPTLKVSRVRSDQVEEFTQRVDHLRVALCGESNNGVARCVLITSAAGGEGKTTLAAQLAGRCANAGLSTLLIDADLRRPRLGQLLDVPEGPGLADVLAGEAEVESALVVIGNAGGFHLLPAGTPALDPSRLLRGRRLGDLIGRLRQTFDIVILDTPPVLPVPDALTMGEWVDGVVLAVRRDASRVSLVERANRMLSAKGIPLLGVVVNGVKTSDMGYGGYTGYMSYASVPSDSFAQPTAAAPVISQDE